MKIHLVPAAAGLVLLAGVGVATADQVIVTPEQQTVVREYVQKHPLASISLLGVELNVGSALPDTVELQEIPAMVVRRIPEISGYKFVKLDDRILLVSAETRQVDSMIPRYKLVFH